jgi:hypothetical protein
MSLRAFTATLLLVLPAFAQDAAPAQLRDDAWKGGAPVPPGAVAVIAGIPVTNEVFVDEMATRGARADNPVGREALNNLIDEILVANEASRRQITVTEPDLDRRVRDIDCQLRQHKTCLEAEMRTKNISMETFRGKLRKQILLELLTREDQRIPANQPVGNDQQKVWLKNRRDAAKVEVDRARLNRGETALIDGTPVEDKVFVRALLASADRKEIRKVADFLLQYVFGLHLLEQAGSPLTEADVEQEFQDRKRAFESNPEFRGIEYEAIVKERTGFDAAALKQSRGFRLNAAVSKLARRLFSETDVRGYYETNLSYFGPRYSVTHLLIKGSDRPLRDQSGKALTQPLAQARQQIEGIKRQIDEGKRLEDLVPMYSEHLPTKIRGGRLDAFTPKNAPAAFPELGEAVTKLDVDRVSGPILTSAGYHLVRVDRIDPPPPIDQVEGKIREILGTRYFNDAYDKAAKGYDIRID